MCGPALCVAASGVGRSGHGDAVGSQGEAAFAVVGDGEGRGGDGAGVAAEVPADSRRGDDGLLGIHSPGVGDGGVLGLVAAGVGVVCGPALCVAASGVGRSGHGDTVGSQGEGTLAVVGDGECRGGDGAGVATEVG